MEDQTSHTRKPHSQLGSWSLWVSLAGIVILVLQMILSVGVGTWIGSDNPLRHLFTGLIILFLVTQLIATVLGAFSLFTSGTQKWRGILGMLMSGGILLVLGIATAIIVAGLSDIPG